MNNLNILLEPDVIMDDEVLIADNFHSRNSTDSLWDGLLLSF